MAAVVTAAAVAAAVLAVPAPAQAASAEESKIVALTNQVRSSVGAPALVWDESLAVIARTWAAKMAADGIISHNPTVSKQISGAWSKVSENVGQGPDIDTVHQALVASRSHYLNMTDTEVTFMGVGVVTKGNTVFIVENFLGRPGAAVPKTVTTRAPAPPTTKAAAPPTTAALKPPAEPKPAAPTTTVPVTAPAAVPVAASFPPPDASPWMILAIEVTRTWERTTGSRGPTG
ncbi:MAG TPA: CAP domain-containing protein [Acidimicrobiales bacterium]|nr:CAP domain-containing protein [Acidimicrobiales bacterium]